MHAIILAGGFGTRLKSAIGEDIPKPMAPINGEPFLAIYMRYLKKQGITDVLLSVHHLAHVIRDHFGDEYEGIKLRYAEEKTPLGTGGAVQFALEHLNTDEPILVVNGDSFIEFNVKKMLEAHREAGTTLSIALREMPDCSRYGQVIFNEENCITSFKYPGDKGQGWISTGAYIVSPEIFDTHDMPEAFSFENDFQHKYVETVRPHAYLTEGYFIDIGVPDDYARAQEELKKRIEEKKAA